MQYRTRPVPYPYRAIPGPYRAIPVPYHSQPQRTILVPYRIIPVPYRIIPLPYSFPTRTTYPYRTIPVQYNTRIIPAAETLHGGAVVRHVEHEEGKGGVLQGDHAAFALVFLCLLYTSPSPRDGLLSRMPSSA